MQTWGGDRRNGPHDIEPARHEVASRIRACPCGCETKPPWFDDAACARRRSLTSDAVYPGYTARDLGLTPHDRAPCRWCVAVAP